MTVSELVEQLQEMNPDAEVCLAMQPQWSFEYSVKNDLVESDDHEKVYLAEQDQTGYLDSEISEKLGW
jgi:hypothetical protein